MISLVRLTILFPRLQLNSMDLNYSFVNFGSWSIAESNMTIVAGTVTKRLLQTPRLNSFTACLPSLGPILSLILYGEPDPSVRRSRGTAFGPSWTRSQSSAMIQMHGQPISSSESRQNFVPLPDEAYGLSGIEQLHGIASTSSGEPNNHNDRDIEMQTGSRWALEGIEVRTDVTVQLTQK